MERWTDIKGYEGLYLISDLGNVKSLNYRSTGREELLKPAINSWGYLRVCLYKNGEIKTHKVHRLVAEAFIPNPLNLPEVNHKDENKLNNNVDNLEWCTAKYNNNYGTRIEKCFKPVAQYDLKGNLIKEWKSIIEIQRVLGYFSSNISACCRGKIKTAHGFIWQYV